MPTVKQYKSETVLFFGLTAVASVVTELAANPEFKAALGDNATFVILGMSIAGYVLRKFTTKPLDPIIRKQKPPPTQHEKNLDILHDGDEYGV